MDLAPSDASHPPAADGRVRRSGRLLAGWWTLLVYSVLLACFGWFGVPAFTQVFMAFGADLHWSSLLVMHEAWRLVTLPLTVLTPTLVLTFVTRITPSRQRKSWITLAILASLAALASVFVAVGLYMPLWTMNQPV